MLKPYHLVYALLLGSLIVGVLKYCGDSKYNKPTLISSDTTYVTHIEYKDRPVYLTKIQAKIDTIYINNEPQIVATADTLLTKDSSTVKVKYYFPPLNYFSVDMNIKDKFVYKTVTVKEQYIVPKTFWDKFHFGLQAGLGLGTISKQLDLYVGYGISFEL